MHAVNNSKGMQLNGIIVFKDLLYGGSDATFYVRNKQFIIIIFESV